MVGKSLRHLDAEEEPEELDMRGRINAIVSDM
jgi:hypothetical protein